MNTLRKNNIKLNWFSAYAGLYKGWITPLEILQYMDGDLLKKLDDTTIIKLYSNEHKSDKFFLKIIEDILCNVEKTEILNKGLIIWRISFLLEIYNSDEEIHTKLRKIDDVWAEFDYPEEWRSFIYYLPIEDNIQNNNYGENEVYKKFMEYLSNEIKKLK